MLGSESKGSQGKFLGSEAHHIWIVEKKLYIHVDHHIVIKAGLANHAYSLYVVKGIAFVQLIVELLENPFLHYNHISLSDWLLKLGHKFSDLIIISLKVL